MKSNNNNNNNQKPPVPFKNTSITNKTTITIATTDNKHKYFDNSSNNRNSQHPILNNGFMKPQIVIGGNDTSFQNETSSSSSSSSSSSNSSFNNNNNNNNNTAINLNRRLSLNSNQNETNILDSQKARDAFYKSLRTIENKPSQTVVQQQQQKQIINSKLQNNTSSSSTSTSSIQSSSHNQSSSSSRSTTSCELKDLNVNVETKSLNRTFDFKNNFSNLVKIDTRFKSDSFDLNYNKNEESQNQLRLLEESQNRMKHFQELINQQKARHRETITSLLHRRQNLAHAKSNSFNFPSNNEKITEPIYDSNVDTNEEKLSNLIIENNVPLNNSTPNESLTSLKSITVSTPKELNQKFQTYNENNSILSNKTTTVSTLTNKTTTNTNSQDLKFKIQNIINTAVETQTKQKNIINNSNPVQITTTTTTTTTIKTITTNNLSNVIMPKNGIDQVEKEDDEQDDDNNYDQELDDDGDDDDDDDYNELDQKDKKKSKTTATSSDIYSSLSSASLAEESDSENDENSIPTTTSTKTDKNDEDYVTDVQSMSDILSKYGFDYKYLFNETTIKKSDQNTLVIQPPLTLSLFANVPPTIKFITQDEKINQLPESLNRLCKWKMCSITPNIVKATISRSNFKLANGKHDWIGVWGSHMKPECFRAIREYQKINHLPGSFQIGRKDRLCRNLYHAQAVFGKQEYNFVPITYVLPQDYNLLKQEIETKNCKWIIKPPASARGQGIRVVNKIEQIPKKRACVVQKYLSNPYLIDGLKFDLRIYVYVTSYDPLRIYIFNDGLTRFASRKYSNSSKTIGDKFMHLTNFSINKTNKEYKSNDDENACVGHKWSLKALWAYLQKKGINTDKIWEQIKDLAIKTIICGDPHVNILVKTHLKRKYSVHELFGFDVILDENLKPWIVEVNISPSLNSSSPLDVSVKGQMICDLFNLAGFMLPDPREIAKQEGKKSYKKIPKFLHFNKSVLPQILSNDEKTKHQYFIQRQNDDRVMSSILDRLTPDDLRILIESEDEYNRRGSFTRIFPSSNSQKYLRLFETTRYYNLLLNEWVSRYRNNRDRAITLLNSYCQKNIHLQNPSRQAENCWSSSSQEANK